LSFVNEVARASTYPGDGYDNLSSSVGIEYPDGTVDEQQVFYAYEARPSYFNVLDIGFIAGKAFKDNKNGSLENVVINEKFAKQMGYANPEDVINKQVKLWGETCVITGVIEDYHHFGLKNEVQSLLIFDSQPQPNENVLLKLNASSTSLAAMNTSLDEIKKKYKSIFPNSTLNFTFLDEKFEAQYTEDRKFGIAFQIFTLLAIFIAALGLFGLTSYMCLQRRKEIGIRKVTGASIFQILKLLNRDFILLVVFALVIAIPVAWYIMNEWLQEFAYKTELSWWVFALAAITTVFIALITVSFQSIKAAMANPVKSLRTE